MGRKRNLSTKDENNITKKKRGEVVIKTDSVIELISRLSSELRTSVANILVNYEGKENMDELLPHLLHSVSVDNQLASQIQQSFGVQVSPCYEDWYNSIDQIELEIYRIHASNNNDDENADLSITTSVSQSSNLPANKDKCGTDSGNSSINSNIFNPAELSYTDLDIDALFMDIITTSNSCLLDTDRDFAGIPPLPDLPPLPPLPFAVTDEALPLKQFVRGESHGISLKDVLLAENHTTASHVDVEDNLSSESSKLNLLKDALPNNVENELSPHSSMCSPALDRKASTKDTLNSASSENIAKLSKCTVDFRKVNNPLSVNKINLTSNDVTISDERLILNSCDNVEDSKIDFNDSANSSSSSNSAKSAFELENENISELKSTEEVAVDTETSPSKKVVKPSPPKTRSKSKVVESEAELLQLIDLVDSDDENHTTEAEDEKEDDSKCSEKVEQSSSKTSDEWQPSVVLKRIDTSKLVQKEKEVKKFSVTQVRRSIANMKKYVKVEKPDIKQINDAMETTFAYRRTMVTDPDISVNAVLKEFPALSLFEVVKCECDRLLGDKLKTLEELLGENFVRAATTKKIKSPHKLFIEARKAFKKTDSLEIKKITGMVCLAFYLAEKQAVGSLFQIQTKKKKIVSKLTPMMILDEADLFTENREIRIFADGTEMLKVPDFYEGVLTIYSLYYVLDIVYDKNVTLLFQYFDFLIGLPQSSFSTQPV